MTNEQIDAIKAELEDFLDDVDNEAPELSTEEAEEHIRVLCEAAREPDNHVGRRARIPHLGLRGRISAKLNPQWQIDFDVGGMEALFREDFELLEDDHG